MLFNVSQGKKRKEKQRKEKKTLSFVGGRQTHFPPEINVYETHSSAAGVKPRRDLDDSRRNEGGKERQEKKKEKGEERKINARLKPVSLL